ncbi:RNA polymerase sigma factor [Streptomyces zaomyceticus]
MPERGVLPDFADDVLARMTDGEQIRAARAALGKLRRREREVFTLVVWAGLDYAAAGEALGVPVGTVRSRLSRARERLRKLADAELRTARREERAAAAAVRSPSRAVVPETGRASVGRSPVRARANAGSTGERSPGEPGPAEPSAPERSSALPVAGAVSARSTVRPAPVPRSIPENQA